MHWLDAFFFVESKKTATPRLPVVQTKMEKIQYQRYDTFLILGFLTLMWQGNPFLLRDHSILSYGMHHKGGFNPGSFYSFYPQKKHVLLSKKPYSGVLFSVHECMFVLGEAVAQIICKLRFIIIFLHKMQAV